MTLKAENAQLESSLLDEKRESSQLSAKLNSEVRCTVIKGCTFPFIIILL